MLDKEVLLELERFVDRRLDPPEPLDESETCFRLHTSYAYFETPVELEKIELENYIELTRKPTFREVLFGFIEEKGASNADIYNKAGLDRRHFSKIRSNSSYQPGKITVIALVLALELDEEEAGKLLRAAGYSLSESNTYDLVIQFCLQKKIYDIDEVNYALNYFSLSPLIGVLE